MDSNMVRRIAVAVIAIPALCAVVWFGSWPFAIVLCIVSVLGARELFDIAERTGVTPMRGMGLLVTGIIPIGMVSMLEFTPSLPTIGIVWPFAALAAVILVLTNAVFARSPSEKPLGAIAITMMAPVYTGLLPSVAFLIRHAQWSSRSWVGTVFVFFPLVVTWVCDSAAMFAGRMIGGPKMAPSISPGKTRAGGIAGIVGGVVVGVVFAQFVFPAVQVGVSMVPIVALAAVIAVLGQIGDLAESLLKREAGVKDSSNLIPGHGGVLDRLDSLYFAIPVAALGYHLMGVL